MPDTELDKQPTPGGPVNQPASGTQGDIAAVDRLRSSLPPVPGAPPPGQGPDAGSVQSTVPGPGGGPTGAPTSQTIPGVPESILGPTDRPGTPVETPPQGFPGGDVPQMAPNNRRMQVLSALQQSEDPEVREWANLVLEMLTS